MRPNWRRHVPAVGAACLLMLGVTGVRADWWRETAFVVTPTAYVDVSPTSYVVPTNYVLASPTYAASSYFLPTSYVTPYVATSVNYVERDVYTPTSYVVPTAYYELAGGYVPTSYYVPTAYTLPTVYETVATYAACTCGPTAAPASYVIPRAVVTAPAREQGRPAATNGSRNTEPNDEPAVRATPSDVESVPEEKETGPTGSEPANIRESAPVPPTSSAVDAGMPSPPVAPAADPDAAVGSTPPVGNLPHPAPVPPPPSTPITPPEPAAVPPASDAKPPADAVKPPVAPGGGGPLELPPPGFGAADRREVRKPVLPGKPAISRAARRDPLNVLEGKVVSGKTGQTEEDVLITLSNRQGTFADRQVRSDAYGRYAVRLPDGDWTVRVTMPSGRSYAVSELTVSKGQIVDDQGRDVPTLRITR